MIKIQRKRAAVPAHFLSKSTKPTPVITVPVELMTVLQAAHFAQVSQPTIRRWIRCDGLAVYRSKGRVRIDKSDLVKFLRGEVA